MRTTFLPERHPDVAKLYSNIGTIHFKKREYKESIEMYEKALAAKVQCYLETHPEVAVTRGNLALALARRGEGEDTERADQLYRKAMAVLTGRRLANVKENYSELLKACGRYEDALRQLTEARVEFTKAKEMGSVVKVRHVQLT